MKLLSIVSLIFSVIGIITQLLLIKYTPHNTAQPVLFAVCVFWFFASCFGWYSTTKPLDKEFEEYVKRNSNKNKYHD